MLIHIKAKYPSVFEISRMDRFSRGRLSGTYDEFPRPYPYPWKDSAMELGVTRHRHGREVGDIYIIVENSGDKPQVRTILLHDVGIVGNIAEGDAVVVYGLRPPMGNKPKDLHTKDYATIVDYNHCAVRADKVRTKYRAKRAINCTAAAVLSDKVD